MPSSLQPLSVVFAGIVRTSVIVTGVQVFSRIFMVWFIASSIRQVTVPPLSPLTFISQHHSSGMAQVKTLFLPVVLMVFLNQDPE